MLSVSNSWTKCLDMVKIGRIHYIVDAANNKTMTSTSFSEQVSFTSKGYSVTLPATDLVANKSRIITRTDVDAHGTVTFVDRSGSTM